MICQRLESTPLVLQPARLSAEALGSAGGNVDSNNWLGPTPAARLLAAATTTFAASPPTAGAFSHSSNPIHRYGCLAMTIHCVGQVYLDPTESADMTIRPLHKFCTKAHTINTFIITNIIRVPFPLDLDPDRRIIISLPLLLDPSRAELGPCISAQIQSPRRQQLAHEATFNLLPQEAEEHPLPSPLRCSVCHLIMIQ